MITPTSAPGRKQRTMAIGAIAWRSAGVGSGAPLAGQEVDQAAVAPQARRTARATTLGATPLRIRISLDYHRPVDSGKVLGWGSGSVSLRVPLGEGQSPPPLQPQPLAQRDA